MLSFGSGGAQVCVVGRTDFTSEAGALAGAMAEALARSFPVAYLPTDAAADRVTLPSGRKLPVCRDTAAITVSVHCDGPGSEVEAPGHLRYAWVSCRDELDAAGGVAWLNATVDAVLVPSAALVDAGRQTGVRRPMLQMPAPVDLDVPSLPPSHVVARLAALVDPSIAAFRGVATDPALLRLTEMRLGRRADVIGGIRRVVCPAHDGEFFSVFNAYLEHLAWQQREDRCHAVLPDWDVDRLLGRPTAPTRRFRYGQPGDGNLWSKLFQPPFGATEVEMSDPRFLYRHATLPADSQMASHAVHDAVALRRYYHRILTQHVRLRPEHHAEIDAFAAVHLTAPILIAAHVRHPGNTIEQVRAVVRQRGGDPAGPGWTVFVATDQERVLDQFRTAFGDRVVCFADAHRAGPSWRSAWEIVRDAQVMARCHTLLHDFSDVSTAVSYINPEIEMVCCDP